MGVYRQRSNHGVKRRAWSWARRKQWPCSKGASFPRNSSVLPVIFSFAKRKIQNGANRHNPCYLAYLKMRFERGLCLGIRNADRDDAGRENLDAAADARLAAERNTDLAADIEWLCVGFFNVKYFFFLYGKLVINEIFCKTGCSNIN